MSETPWEHGLFSGGFSTCLLQDQRWLLKLLGFSFFKYKGADNTHPAVLWIENVLV